MLIFWGIFGIKLFRFGVLFLEGRIAMDPSVFQVGKSPNGWTEESNVDIPNFDVTYIYLSCIHKYEYKYNVYIYIYIHTYICFIHNYIICISPTIFFPQVFGSPKIPRTRRMRSSSRVT